MALANVAYILAWQSPPTKVLMIDWDLEAPGLHKFFDGQIKGRNQDLVSDVYNNPVSDSP